MNTQVPTSTSLGLRPGDPFPRIRPPAQSRPTFAVDSVAGRYIVLCFYGSMNDLRGRHAVEVAQRRRDLFDGRRAWFFGVSMDPADKAEARVRDAAPGITFLWDFEASVSEICGAVSKNDGAEAQFKPLWLVVDPTLHVLMTVPFGPDPNGHQSLFNYLDSLPAPERFAGFDMPIPTLLLPNVFDHDLVPPLDWSLRRPWRPGRRVLPEIERLFFMKITHMERYIVGCYAEADEGHFQPHRDNTSQITEHRRFAVSLNLNADFSGGELVFPEYSPRFIKAAPGWCIVFPANILHTVSTVTKGRRYAFLPFVYDESGAAIRAANFRRIGAAQPSSQPASM